jgi:DNA repair protein RadC
LQLTTLFDQKPLNDGYFSNQLYQVAEVQLVYRNETLPENRIKINSSQQAYKLLQNSWDYNRIDLIEQFKIILLDFQLNCLGISEISTGGVSMCPVDFKILWATALKGRAAKIIGAHNHPSGFPYPSEADLELNRRMISAGELLGIPVVEQMIITSHDYYSFADNGLIP